MVAQTPPIPFTPDPARVEEFLEDISCFDMCLRDVAKKHGTTLGGLALYITSEDGLQTIATSELAAALRIRLTALHLLPDVVNAMGYIVNEYAREERRIPMENSLRRIRLLELKRRNAHRAGTLIFKLAHFNPRPIRSYTVRPAAQSAQTCSSSIESDDLAAQSVQTCGMPKRPLGHGSASDIGAEPLTTSPCACHDHPRLCEDDRVPCHAIEVDGFASTSMNASCAVQDDPAAQSIQPCASCNESDDPAAQSVQTCAMPKRPLGHGSAPKPDFAASRAIQVDRSASTSMRFTSLLDDEVSASSSHVSLSHVSSPPVSSPPVSPSPVSPSSTHNSDPPSSDSGP